MTTTYTDGEQIGAILLVVFLAAVAGSLLDIAGEGYTVPYFNWKIKPLFTKIRIPAIIAMIIMGCITRNFFGQVVKPYNSAWALWIRTCCLAILLVRGGL